MNGLSFAEFENSSFDDLYSKGFANAKHLEQVAFSVAKTRGVPAFNGGSPECGGAEEALSFAGFREKRLQTGRRSNALLGQKGKVTRFHGGLQETTQSGTERFQVSKELQHLKPGAPAALSFGRTAQAVDAAPLHARADTAQVRRLPTPAAARDPRADRGAAVVPLNDLGVMPGNSHVDHAWRPSKDAHLQMKGGPSSQPTEARRPSNQGAFVGWRSN
ncbi:unnamed protein product [Durusdinium trenchii]|uniref:Uncharacterized protein n=1 Tax=Durusdinium trenchii TaxID=1381693 RepID=A0ABP0QIR4_9DINO